MHARAHTQSVCGTPESVRTLTPLRAPPTAQEDLFLEMMHIGFRKLDRAELGELFSQCAIGTFFDDEPIAYYGGRVACFAAACNMRKVVNTMHLMQEVIGFDPVNECPAVWSKYLPIHAAAANGLSSMVEYLVEKCGGKLDAECRDGFSMVRPMVLAARLGMQTTFKDLLERRATFS